MAKATLEIKIHFAWWLQPYLTTLVFFCLITGDEPDWVKLEVIIKKATRLKVGKRTYPV